MQHEDNLINHRLLWNLNIQGFLFATYGFCLQKILEIDERVAEFNNTPPPTGAAISLHKATISFGTLAGLQDLEKVAHYVIPGIGFVVALTSFLGTLAARRAIQRLELDWKKKVLKLDPDDKVHCDRVMNSTVPFLPNLTGGGSKRARMLGFGAPLLTPVCFCLGWICLFFFKIR